MLATPGAEGLACALEGPTQRYECGLRGPRLSEMAVQPPKRHECEIHKSPLDKVAKGLRRVRKSRSPSTLKLIAMDSSRVVSTNAHSEFESGLADADWMDRLVVLRLL